MMYEQVGQKWWRAPSPFFLDICEKKSGGGCVQSPSPARVKILMGLGGWIVCLCFICSADSGYFQLFLTYSFFCFRLFRSTWSLVSVIRFGMAE